MSSSLWWLFVIQYGTPYGHWPNKLIVSAPYTILLLLQRLLHLLLLNILSVFFACLFVLFVRCTVGDCLMTSLEHSMNSFWCVLRYVYIIIIMFVFRFVFMMRVDVSLISAWIFFYSFACHVGFVYIFQPGTIVLL